MVKTRISVSVSLLDVMLCRIPVLLLPGVLIFSLLLSAPSRALQEGNLEHRNVMAVQASGSQPILSPQRRLSVPEPLLSHSSWGCPKEHPLTLGPGSSVGLFLWPNKLSLVSCWEFIFHHAGRHTELINTYIISLSFSLPSFEFSSACPGLSACPNYLECFTWAGEEGFLVSSKASCLTLVFFPSHLHQYHSAIHSLNLLYCSWSIISHVLFENRT